MPPKCRYYQFHAGFLLFCVFVVHFHRTKTKTNPQTDQATRKQTLTTLQVPLNRKSRYGICCLEKIKRSIRRSNQTEHTSMSEPNGSLIRNDSLFPSSLLFMEMHFSFGFCQQNAFSADRIDVLSNKFGFLVIGIELGEDLT